MLWFQVARGVATPFRFSRECAPRCPFVHLALAPGADILGRGSSAICVLALGQKGWVCIDITSGTKIYTGAATTFAVTRGIPFSYVDNTGRVHYAMARVEMLNHLEP